MVTSQETETGLGCQYGVEYCRLQHQHELDLVLCASLESLADLLPGLPPTAELRHLTERLQLASARWANNTRPMLTSHDGTMSYRLLDAIHAEDVIEAIWHYWRKPGGSDADRLAYMLRALFDGCRRAVVIERLAFDCSNCQFAASD